MTHAIERTNAKGELFVGRCILCGREGLTMGDVLKECDNPAGTSSDATLLALIEGPTTGAERSPKEES